MRTADDVCLPENYLNAIVEGDAVEVLQQLPDECVALAVTSPPYWNVVDYSVDRQIGQSSYDDYLADLLQIWKQTQRVLIPNGKLAIVTPIMPIPKAVIDDQHTRHLKNINNDIEATILKHCEELERFSLFVWQKQTTEKMFGSYPHPPNIYEDNTIEFINVFVKRGKPLSAPDGAKEASRLTQQQWRNLTMQVWPMYPADVTRAGGHPCPFPVVLPQRLIMMYTFAACADCGFKGDLVLDMFSGTGATCLAASGMKRNYLGIDINAEYCEIARRRLQSDTVDPKAIFLKRVEVAAPVSARQLSLFGETLQ